MKRGCLSGSYASLNNPVLYLNPGSVVSDYVLTLIMDTAERMRKIGEADFGATMSFYELMSYLKPYKGYIWKHGKLWKEKIFYNEKEWRYVPALSGVDGVAYRLNLKDYADEEKRDEANQSLEGKAPLHFDPSDIKYILISDEAEILPLLKEIEMSKGGKYNYNDLRILSTKILTIDKVLEDM